MVNYKSLFFLGGSFRQVGPFPCNCSLYPLAVWAHRRKVKGVRCWHDDVGVAKITSLLQMCNSKGMFDNMRDKINFQSCPRLLVQIRKRNLEIHNNNQKYKRHSHTSSN